MKKYFFLVFLSFLFCFESKSQRIIDVPFTSDDKISIDGILEQKEWENSEKLSLNFITYRHNFIRHNAQIFEPGHMETKDDYDKIALKFSKIYQDWKFTKNQIYDMVKDFYIPY